MTSDWLKIMLDEIARKEMEAEQARVEEERRSGVVVESGRCVSRKQEIGDAE